MTIPREPLSFFKSEVLELVCIVNLFSKFIDRIFGKK